MKIKNTLPHLTAILFLILAFSSCQEDFSTLGSDIIGGQDINTVFNNSSTVIAYSRKLEAVQTNNLPLYQLGTFNDPVFGKSKVEMVSQLKINPENPDFGFGTILDSVVLYIPYLSEVAVLNEVNTYTLDSVFGSNPIDIKIYESNYFLRDYDPTTGLQEPQKYYSTLGEVFEIPSNVGPLISEIHNFKPSNKEFVLLSPDGEDEDTDLDITLLEPGLRVLLDTMYFNQKIISKEGTQLLINNNNFKEYFRGLYFKIDDLGSDGNLFLFDIGDASIKLYYSYQETEVTNPPNDDVVRLNGELLLSFDGINVSLFDNVLTPSIDEALNNPPNEIDGEESLYLRGGEGTVSIINLFGIDADQNGVADELEFIRQNEWLINEANLIFYVDQDKVTGGDVEPDRIIIYDAVNAQVLADYGRDPTISNSPEDAVTGHLGKLQRGTDSNGDYYKIRITHHISNLIHKDSTNVPLALTVTQNVLSGGFQTLKDEQDSGLDKIPSAGVISHEGTVLFGNNTTNEARKLRLQIYYTDPN